jgi:hypothetical protein
MRMPDMRTRVRMRAADRARQKRLLGTRADDRPAEQAQHPPDDGDGKDNVEDKHGAPFPGLE